jgi:hypothetical protein
MALQKRPRGTGVSSAARTLAASLQQIPDTPVGNGGLTSAMTNPMSNIVFDMAAATLSNGSLRGASSNAPAPR